MYVQVTFTVQKDHIKCTEVQKEVDWSPFLGLIFNQAIFIDTQNAIFLTKKV